MGTGSVSPELVQKIFNTWRAAIDPPPARTGRERILEHIEKFGGAGVGVRLVPTHG